MTAKDAFGNVATGYTGTVAVTSSDGAATLPASHTYVGGDAGIAVFPVTFATSGSQTVTATDTGNGAIQGMTTIGVGAGAASATTSTIGASPGSITADGSSTTTITVRLKDVFGTSLSAGGATVALSTTGGTLSAVTDNSNGTYTATLTAPSIVGSGVVSGTVNGTAIVSTATVTFHVPIGPASGATSTIGASPGSIAPDGSSTSTITVQLEDAAGNDPDRGRRHGRPLDDRRHAVGGHRQQQRHLHRDADVGFEPRQRHRQRHRQRDRDREHRHCHFHLRAAAPAAFVRADRPDLRAAAADQLGRHRSACRRRLLLRRSRSSARAPRTERPWPRSTRSRSPPTTWRAGSRSRSQAPTGRRRSPRVFGVSYSQPFAPTKPGAYTLTATMDDGFNPTQTVTVHFTVVPPLPNVALPGRSGSVVSASDVITVHWTAGTFTVPVRVTAEDVPTIGGAFGNGSRVVRVTVTRLSDGTALESFDEPLELVFDAGLAGVPSFSEDGVSWSPVPELSSDVLPTGQPDGYYTDSTGAVHLLTHHLTYFGMLSPRATKLTLVASGSVSRLPNGGRRISMTVQVSTGARVVATLLSPDGRLVKTWSRFVPAGTSRLDLTLPGSKVQSGDFTIVLRATAAGQTTRSSIRVRLR